MNSWINFCVVIGVQLLFFLFLAHRKRAFGQITPGLVLGAVLAGVAFGMTFDLVLGRYLGVCDYALHFTQPFLVINGALSYGLWLLTIWLLRSERLLGFCLWTMAIGLVYEFADHFYPVWSWTFPGSFWLQEGIVIVVAYCGLALVLALGATLTRQTRFRAVAWYN